jgi:hypothetical protein
MDCRKPILLCSMPFISAVHFVVRVLPVFFKIKKGSAGKSFEKLSQLFTVAFYLTC